MTGAWTRWPKYAPDMNYDFTYIPVPKEGDQSATWAGGWSVALIPGLAGGGPGVAVHAVLRRARGPGGLHEGVEHLPTLSALLTDTSLYDEQHAKFLDFLEVAHNRPPLAVGAIYWDALTTAQGSVELNTKEPWPRSRRWRTRSSRGWMRSAADHVEQSTVAGIGPGPRAPAPLR